MEYASAESGLINTLAESRPGRRSASVDELSKSSIGYRPREHANVNVKAWERSTEDRRKARQEEEEGEKKGGREGRGAVHPA